MPIKTKRIFILPVAATVLSILILYRFLLLACGKIINALYNAIFDRHLDFTGVILYDAKYLGLFALLILMSLTDSLFEKIKVPNAIFLIVLGFIFAAAGGERLLSVVEWALIGSGIFVVVNITRLGSYAMGDVLCAGAIGIFVGVWNMLAIALFSIIMGIIAMRFGIYGASIFRKTEKLQLHMAFVPFLLLSTAVLFYFGRMKF
ncbi:MAG: hypothetical protein EVJ48_02965 [Candidatus Acidulodesulfobacterium acidiphilum]|uniref:Uncharacterized protein n=1 Tax=Candidatus Acidulodesulfobacterium acidiphilum TaxID=2597224 RepID=A0A520XFF1_9DELT|nr:MAG: hypothetical protein EVJ48_02965 [Candidatus Acidulodesulfobacterium acidiphilum]